MLDEYSDPADCKKQFEEMRGDGAVLPVVEDDYSVPYEVKKLFKGLYCIPERVVEREKGFSVREELGAVQDRGQTEKSVSRPREAKIFVLGQMKTRTSKLLHLPPSWICD